MIDPTTPSSPGDDARLELSLAASSNERANRPVWAIALGVVLLVIAIIYSLWAVSARAKVLLQVSSERAKVERLLKLKSTLDAESAKLSARASPPDPRTGQHLEALATAAGITPPPTVTDQPPIGSSGATALAQHTYTARVQNEDPQQILNWLVSTQSSPQTQGLEISRLVLRPGAATSEGTPGWNAEVNFIRWEKR